MNNFEVINILDMIEALGEDETRSILSDFSCSKNHEIENFVKKNAIDFAKRKISITYLVVDRTETVRAIFTLTHKALEVGNKSLSNTMRRRMQRYATLDERADSFMTSAFLIAQFGKNDVLVGEENISGNALMDLAFEVLTSVQHDIGGGLVYLECEDRKNLLTFYSSEPNAFFKFGERYSETDNVKYIQLFRFI